MPAPLIGISGGRVLAAVLPGAPDTLMHLPVDTAIAAYAEHVAAAGGIPIHVPRSAEPNAVTDRLDGLVIAGGGDVDPRRYGATPGPSATTLDPDRDEHEVTLIRCARARQLPVLAICRGIQVLNVALGGTLVAHLPSDSGQAHSFLHYPVHHQAHRVTLKDGSRLAGIFGIETWTNSLHHQAIDAPGDGLTVVGVADDGVIEAVEIRGEDVIGVQWHPEMMNEAHNALFSWLVERASGRRPT